MIRVQIEEINDVVIIHLNGKFILENLTQLDLIWKEMVNIHPHVIAIDCEHIQQIDSSAIGTLVKYLNDAMQNEIELTIYDLEPSFKHLFYRAKLQNYFTITTREEFQNHYLTKEKIKNFH